MNPVIAPETPVPAPRSHGAGTAPASRRKERTPGRNLPAAIAVGVFLSALLVAGLFWQPRAFPLVVGLAILIGVLELVRALASHHLRVPALPVLVAAIGMVVSTTVYGEIGLALATAIGISVVILWRCVESMGRTALGDVTAGVFTLAWVPFLGCFLLLLLPQPNGPMLVLLAIAVPAANDIGGYFTGVLIGTHPMAPSISPKKTWEGFIGSLVFGIGAATAIVVLAMNAPWWHGLIIGAVLVVVATTGDLAQSLLKRDLGIKDMGTILPGHGGMLDRIDSMLLAAPAVYIAWELLP